MEMGGERALLVRLEQQMIPKYLNEAVEAQ